MDIPVDLFLLFMIFDVGAYADYFLLKLSTSLKPNALIKIYSVLGFLQYLVFSWYSFLTRDFYTAS